MIAYFETSAVLKLFVDERGSHKAERLWSAADRVVTNRITYAEARAALASAARGRRLAPVRYRASVARLRRIWQGLFVVPVSELIAQHAGDLSEEHSLRGYDAVHLASALAIAGEQVELVVVTWDKALSAAARHSGLAVAP